MMGRSHSLSGTTAWAAIAALTPLAHIHPDSPALVAGLLTTAGAALLPDLDHPSGSIANTFGPVSKAAVKIVHRISGGHRHATHSLLFAALASLTTWAGIDLGHGYVGLPVMFVLFAFGIRALHLAPGIVVGAAAGATVAAGIALHGDYRWLPYSVGAGALAHLIGDCLTKQGCPLFWPAKQHFKAPIIQRTNNAVEHWAVAPAFALGTVALLAPHAWVAMHAAV